MSLEHRALTMHATRWVSVSYVLGGSLVLAASARIATPFMTVPTTLQTYALLVLAAVFGPRLATAMTVTYLLEGALGLPVFAAGAAGPLVLVGPTAGYLFAFPVAALLVGTLYPLTTGRFALVKGLMVMLLAHGLIVASGVAWLTPLMGAEAAVAVGAVPFIAGTLVKSALAVVTARLVRTGLDTSV